MEISGFALLLNGSLLITLLAMMIALFFPEKRAFVACAVAIVFTAVSTGYIALEAILHSTITLYLNAGQTIGTVLLKIDSLSAWFILIIDFTALTMLTYGAGYLQYYKRDDSVRILHYTMMVLFHLSMVMVCMIQDGLAFLIAWEIMSISSFLLILYQHDNQATYKAAMNYFIQMHIAMIMLTVGFILVYNQTGSMQFAALESAFLTGPTLLLFLIFFIGFGIKSGFIPFHTWLPHAHPAAPAHISGAMSGVIVKIGIYGILRVISLLGCNYLVIGEIILSVSILSGLHGIINAAMHRDYKRMLAYCTIENIGIIGIGIGLGLIGIGIHSPLMFCLGFCGALLHALNHSLFKSLLFYAAGSVYAQTHTLNMEKLGGLNKYMPHTSVLFLVGSIAICGLPPFSGFISEFMIYAGLLDGVRYGNITQIILLVLSFGGLSLIGGLSVYTFTKTYGTIFLGQPRSQLAQTPGEVSGLMLLPGYVILTVMLLPAFLPAIIFYPLSKILVEIYPMFVNDLSAIKASSLAIKISQSASIFVGIVIVMMLIRSILLKRRQKSTEVTWGCGYAAPTAKQQYTGKSFSKPLSKILNTLVVEQKTTEEIKDGEIFPAARSYKSHYLDLFEYYLIGPLSTKLVGVADYFRFIQNGRIQSYVLYGIVFILGVVLMTLFNWLK